jgi:hypothetical protein
VMIRRELRIRGRCPRRLRSVHRRSFSRLSIRLRRCTRRCALRLLSSSSDHLSGKKELLLGSGVEEESLVFGWSDTLDVEDLFCLHTAYYSEGVSLEHGVWIPSILLQVTEY